MLPSDLVLTLRRTPEPIVRLLEQLLRDLGLFEGIADSAGGGSSIGLLPKPDAPAAALEAVGRAICKCAACARILACNIPWLALIRLSTPRACVQVRA